MFQLYQARFIQEITRNSAVASLSNYLGPVPSGKYWCILSASYNPDAAETRTCHFQILGRGNLAFAATAPISIALSGTLFLPLLAPDAVMYLYPGEYLYIQRDVATAGSSMVLKARIVEDDLPYYAYEEPIKKLVARRSSRIVQGLTGGGGAAFSSSVVGPRGGGGGRGESGSEPI